MEIEKNKFFAKKNILRSIILLTICTPLLICAILKMVYYLPDDKNILSGSFLNAFKDLITKLYNGFEPIQYLWPVSPTPNVESIITIGNVLTVILFIGFLWGAVSFQYRYSCY